MQKFKIPWSHWYEDQGHYLWFPPSWDVSMVFMQGAPALNCEDMQQALDNPIGSLPLEELAKGKKSVGIIVDDISRPTPGDILLPMVIGRLEKAGISKDNILIFLSLGAHRPMTKQDMIKKLGEEVVSTVQVLNHNPFEDLVSLGTSKMGNPIKINRRFAETDLKISLGCILPHASAGFGGGAKNIIPGVGGIETLAANHSPAYYEKDGKRYSHYWVGNPDNPLRLDMEDIAQKVGLGFIVNAVFNNDMDIAGLFAGDFVKAHRAGCDLARSVYRTHVSPGADIVILNAYPKDTEFVQCSNAFNVAGMNPRQLIAGDDSTIVLATASTEGAGFHSLGGPGMRLFNPFEQKIPPKSLAGIHTCLYSPNLSEAEIRQFFHNQPRPLFNSWDDLLNDLQKRHGQKAKVAIYPLASMQMAADNNNVDCS